ncbi:MAG: Dam family site-specific DNA-(adenine-N6)-methyltransferase [Methylotenera sp.]
MEIKPLEPFLRWAGGKRWLVNKENLITPPKFNTYFEPFLGSAAVFFSLPKTPFIISDINAELINCYQAIKNDYLQIDSLLRLHQAKHSQDYYYQIRKFKPRNEHTRAARFLYLNRTCFNGLYRVNKQGIFNVPIGSRNNAFLNNDNLKAVAERLSQGKILHQDFEVTMALAGESDFIFIDPPYTVNHNLNGFIAYNEKIFSWEDQVRLKDAVVSAVDRGAMVTMTNADHESIHALYAGLGSIQKVERNSVIAGRASNRGLTSEVLMRFGWDVI